MTEITGTIVTNTSTGVVWATGNQATVFGPGAGNWIACNADPGNQPQPGFLNNPKHNYVITGTILGSGAPYNSGPRNPYGANSEPPVVYAFS